MRGLKFTKANLDALKSADREYFVWSVDLPGFGVRVLPSGKRSWVVQFRDATARTIRRTIGSTKVVPVTLATERAQELLAAARVYGVDLVEQERADARARAKRRDSTLGKIIDAYLAEAQIRNRRSVAETVRYLESAWRPVHDLDGEECTRHDLIPTLRRIAAERGAVSANRARGALSAMFTYAIRQGWLKRDNSPTAYLPTWPEAPRERALSLEELAAVWRAAPLVHETFGRMVKLLILSGCRRSEISDLSWTEVDMARGVIEARGPQDQERLAAHDPLAAGRGRDPGERAPDQRPRVRELRQLGQRQAPARCLGRPARLADSRLAPQRRHRLARAPGRRPAPRRARAQPHQRRPERRGRDL